MGAALQPLKNKKNHYIFSSQLRADQMPGPQRDGQLMCTLFLSMRDECHRSIGVKHFKQCKA